MRYRVHIKMRPGATKRYCHTIIDGRPAGIMEATPGERGWFWYQSEDDSNCPYHRLHTSVISSVARDRDDIVITTMNTIYRFTPEENDII